MSRSDKKGNWQNRQVLTEGVQSVIFFSIPRFLPVENSLRICYDKKQRYSHKMLKMRKVIACVKVES